MKLIDKSALVAEIEKRLNYRIESLKTINNGTFWKEGQSEDEFNESLTRCAFNAAKNELFELKCFLDTLEVKEVQEEPVSEDFEEAADNAFNKVLNTHEIVNVRSCMEMFKYGAQWKEKETLQEVKEKLLHMLNASIDNKHFFEQLDDYIDELENK